MSFVCASVLILVLGFSTSSGELSPALLLIKNGPCGAQIGNRTCSPCHPSAPTEERKLRLSRRHGGRFGGRNMTTASRKKKNPYLNSVRATGERENKKSALWERGEYLPDAVIRPHMMTSCDQCLPELERSKKSPCEIK